MSRSDSDFAPVFNRDNDGSRFTSLMGDDLDIRIFHFTFAQPYGYALLLRNLRANRRWILW